MAETRPYTLRMPAEWEPQAFIQLTWPHADTDWRPILEEITETYVEMADAITQWEPLLIVHPRPKEVKTLLEKRLTPTQMEHIVFFQCNTNDTWARDHGFISLLGEVNKGTAHESRLHLLDFQFNGWGKKFEAGLDNAINAQLFRKWPFGDDRHLIYEDHLDFVLEGGSIESDGKGTIFTTRCCLTAPNRNEALYAEDKAKSHAKTAGAREPSNYQEYLEKELKRRLHAKRIVWFNSEAMDGDDTDGHIDTMIRIAPDNTLLYNKGEQIMMDGKQSDGLSYRMLELPLPSPIYDEDGELLPATYANFLILNGAVLVPTYKQPEHDQEAIRIIQSAFPDRQMVPIDSRSIIKQHGSIHCCTMQYFTNKAIDTL